MMRYLMIAAMFGALAVPLALILWMAAGRPVAPPPATVVSEVPVFEPLPKGSQPARAFTAPQPAPGENASETPEARPETATADRCRELMILAMNNDPESLRTILSELANRESQVRQAAVEAAVQFQSREAIPRLEEAAVQAVDARERATIEAAIEYLKMPTLSAALTDQARQASTADTNPVSGAGGPGAPK